MCAKDTCIIVVPTGGILGFGLGEDELLKFSGRDPVFKPLLSDYLDKGLTKVNDREYNNVIRDIR